MAIDLALAVGVGGGLLEVGLGVWVYAVSPRSFVNRGFALYLVATGLGDIAQFVSALDPTTEGGTPSQRGLFNAGFASYLMAMFGLVAMALAYPRGRSYARRERWVLGAFGALVALSILGIMLAADTRFDVLAGSLMNGLLGVQGIVALWISRTLGAGDDDQQRSTRLVVLGLSVWALWMVAFTGLGLLAAGHVAGVEARILLPGTLAALPVLWADYRLIRKQGGGVRWGPLAILTAAFLLGVLVHLRPELVQPTYFATIYALVGIVSYGILRHDLFSLDRQVRFAIGKTTLAGIFIAVFFVGSEAAQQFFGETLGGPYFGIIAAGALVFVLAPLSRMADRLAEKAVPLPHGAEATASRKERAYRDALAVALRDRRLTPAEEVALARLAEELGIGAGRAMELRHEAAGEEGRQGA